MEYLYSKYDHYLNFISDNKTDRISKKLKLKPNSSKIGSIIKYVSKLDEEIFNSPIETEYKLTNISKNFKKIVFKTEKSEYRLDLHIIPENNQFVNHIAFTQNNDTFDRIPTNKTEYEEYEYMYNKESSKYEMVSLLSRINFILRDLLSKNMIENSFCIGGTEIESKNKIYQYFLEVVVGEGGFKKIKTNIYSTGYGLYFKI